MQKRMNHPCQCETAKRIDQHRRKQHLLSQAAITELRCTAVPTAAVGAGKQEKEGASRQTESSYPLVHSQLAALLLLDRTGAESDSCG
jgi:hypothetical protein